MLAIFRRLLRAQGLEKFVELLEERVAGCMMAELCEDDKANADPVGASIFDHDSSMGLGLDETVDRWVHDAVAGTWTTRGRATVIPARTGRRKSNGGCAGGSRGGAN